MPARSSTSASATPDVLSLRSALLGWYAAHQRQLPWRQDRDPYRVWVSEIMLQQTRVAAVLEHYRLFLEAFPTVAALAAAPEQHVLALWSGLGYYRRARMLHQAAKLVVAQFLGRIPTDLDSIRALPGVGRYTAAAIASIAYGLRAAVVDGNVERVLSRLDGLSRPDAAVWRRAAELLDPLHPGDWNQAMMELGATVCTPQNPQCLVCPVHGWCRAPGAETRRPQPARKRLQLTCALIKRRRGFCLVKRPPDAAQMPGMWELPEVVPSDRQTPICLVRHSITDTNYEVHVVSVPIKALTLLGPQPAWLCFSSWELWSLPLTGVTRKILRKLAIH